MTEHDDTTLVRQCLAGDLSSYGLLVDRYQKPIFNVAFRMLGDQDDAEEVTQSVFVKAFSNLKTFNPRFKFFSWIYRMAINESINLIKSRKSREAFQEETLPADETLEEEAGRADRDEHLQSALMELSEEHRSVVLLKHIEGLSYKEISDILEVSEKRVKSRLYEARQELRRVLTRRGFTL